MDANGAQQTLTITISLKSSVYNSAATESNASIKEKAAQVYYSQNRMITAEDYQVVPLVSITGNSQSQISEQISIRHIQGQGSARSNRCILKRERVRGGRNSLQRRKHTAVHLHFQQQERHTVNHRHICRSKIKRSICQTVLLLEIRYQGSEQSLSQHGILQQLEQTPTQVTSHQVEHWLLEISQHQI